MAEALYYESIAQAYGWPPDVVERQPAELLNRMLTVSGIRNEVEERKARAAGG
jgi:hypothetical protein